VLRLRADSLLTKLDVWRAFRASPSGRVLLPATALLAVVRAFVGEWGWHDLVVLAVMALLVGPFEWAVHKYLLHASPDAWTSRRLGTGSGHREHHIDPPLLRWLLLPGADAAIFLALLMLVAAVSVSPVVVVVSGASFASVSASVTTAWVLTAFALVHYEWVHLLVHTSYRPRSRFYARLARNHRWHHYRNEAHWLGVTSNLGDRLLGTYHATPGAVPLSGTARTLGTPD
jgi:hypothetical protein